MIASPADNLRWWGWYRNTLNTQGVIINKNGGFISRWNSFTIKSDIKTGEDFIENKDKFEDHELARVNYDFGSSEDQIGHTIKLLCKNGLFGDTIDVEDKIEKDLK